MCLYLRYMKLVAVLAILAGCSCSKQRSVDVADRNDITFDLSLCYHKHGSDKYIFDAHRNVPLGKTVVITDLDSLFGVPILSDTVLQTSNSWALYEQESQAADFLPTETGDTLVMMRRIYGREGDWIVWIDVEILASDSLRVLNFLAYDNSQIEI